MPARRAPDLDADIDALFQRPLSEFTDARNALAARLRKEGRVAEAKRVKALAKPSAPAWAVNQLFWAGPKDFDRLFAMADRVRKAQTGLTKNADLGALLDEKKRMTAELMTRAAALLGAAGHAASADALRRVSATLETLAVWGRAEGAPRAGRLTSDLDPPGFDVLAAVMRGSKMGSANVLPFRAPKTEKPPDRRAEEREAERARAAARRREAVEAAEKVLRDARRHSERAEGALTKAQARAAAVEKQKQEIEARYAATMDEARAASMEVKKAAQAVADAERALERARAEVE